MNLYNFQNEGAIPIANVVLTPYAMIAVCHVELMLE